MLSKSEVQKIARLARLELAEAEIDTFTKQLGAILEHAGQLKEVDTEGVEPIAQITGLTNVQHADEVAGCEDPDALLECSAQPVRDRMIKVKNIF